MEDTNEFWQAHVAAIECEGISVTTFFDDWLRDISGCASEGDLSEERLVELVGTTLREVTPEARAKGFVDLANLCYAMADKTLGSQTPVRTCLEVVVSGGQRQ